MFTLLDDIESRNHSNSCLAVIATNRIFLGSDCNILFKCTKTCLRTLRTRLRDQTTNKKEEQNVSRTLAFSSSGAYALFKLENCIHTFFNMSIWQTNSLYSGKVNPYSFKLWKFCKKLEILFFLKWWNFCNNKFYA